MPHHSKEEVSVPEEKATALIPSYYKNLGYNRQTKKFRDPSITKNREEVLAGMRNIQPSTLRTEQFKGFTSFVRFYDDKYTDTDYARAKESDIVEGKWMVCFPKGDPQIDEVWQKLVDCVLEGELEQIKVFPSSVDYDTHALLIYNFNSKDKAAVIKNFDVLRKIIEQLPNPENIQPLVYHVIEPNQQNIQEGKIVHTMDDIDSLRSELTKRTNRLAEVREKLIGLETKIKVLKGKKYDDLAASLQTMHDQIEGHATQYLEGRIDEKTFVDKSRKVIHDNLHRLHHVPGWKLMKVEEVLINLSLALLGLVVLYAVAAAIKGDLMLFRHKQDPETSESYNVASEVYYALGKPT